MSEIFSVPSVFNTAYYATKRPLYLNMLASGDIELKSWLEISKILQRALGEVEAVGAYNAMFDFKKAIPFTELYISKLYSENYYEWEREQYESIVKSTRTPRRARHEFEADIFRYKGEVYPLFDVWALACQNLTGDEGFKSYCEENERVTTSGKYYSTSAETVYQYLTDDPNFDEAHTALADAEIEAEIFGKVIRGKRKNLTMGIVYFPFKMIGERW